MIEDLSEALGIMLGKTKPKDERLKYFKPTIIETFWGTKIIWEERETPLKKIPYE